MGCVTMGSDKALPAEYAREMRDMISDRGFTKTRPGFNRFDPTAQGVASLGPLGLFQFRRKNGQWSTISFSDDGKMYDWPSWIWGMEVFSVYKGGNFTYDPIGDHFYIANSYYNRIVKTKANGEDYETYGEYGSGEGQFDAPASIHWDAGSSSLFIADKGNARIVNTKFGGANWSVANLPGGKLPNGIGYDPIEEYVYTTLPVADHSVAKIKMDESGWVEYGSQGSGVGQFQSPGSIKHDSGVVYVADTTNKRLVKLGDGLNGAGWGTYDLSYKPQGLDLDSSGYFYITIGWPDHLLIKTKWDDVGFESISLPDFWPTSVYYKSTTDFTYIRGGSVYLGIKL